MTPAELIQLLEAFRAGDKTLEETARNLQRPPVADLVFAQVDTHRALRTGFPEVIFGEGKTPSQILAIAAQVLSANERVLITRINDVAVEVLTQTFPQATHHALARCVTIQLTPLPRQPGFIAVLCAGTSDLPVAEEAAVTAEVMGNRVERIFDVGVAGLHRLFRRLDILQQANVLVVVAGMEGALPSVVAGLVRRVSGGSRPFSACSTVAAAGLPSSILTTVSALGLLPAKSTLSLPSPQHSKPLLTNHFRRRIPASHENTLLGYFQRNQWRYVHGGNDCFGSASGSYRS